MSEVQEVRPVEFFGGDSMSGFVTDDFRPSVEHTFDGDGMDEAATAEASDDAPEVPVPADDAPEEPVPADDAPEEPVPADAADDADDDDDDEGESPDAVTLPPRRPEPTKASKARTNPK